ncbi:MAG: zinc-dependent peptidase [Ginsengibacter sp.]
MNYIKKQAVVYFALFGILFLWAYNNHVWEAAAVFGFCIFLGLLFLAVTGKEVTDEEDEDAAEADDTAPYLEYNGNELNFSNTDIVSALTKHLPYFTYLDFHDRQKFIERLNKFISGKIFKIHDSSGFKEMPILISATAIQLSFGLDHYLLPNFKFVNIYPRAFVTVEPAIRFLEGNVNGKNINISWNFFLKGFQFPDDGDNVGLHEMAHAYYYQNFDTSDSRDMKFIRGFSKFNVCGKEVFQHIAQNNDGMYSDYSKRNFQEFWAESVELFFEKPGKMRNKYHELYRCICEILNQDPLNKLR